MDQSKLRRYIKRGVALAGLGLGLAAGVMVPAGLANASTGPTVSHRFVTVSDTPTVTGPTTVRTLDMTWF